MRWILARNFENLLALPSSSSEVKNRQFVGSLAKGLEVLRAFEPGESYLGNLELSRRTKLSKPTIARITYTLTSLGYLDYNAALEKYALGTSVLSLGYAYLSSMGITRAGRSHMQELANHANISVAMGSRDRLNLAYIELAHGSETVSLRLEVGARIPISKSAMGLAYLFALPEGERNFLIDAIQKGDPKSFNNFKKRMKIAFKELKEFGYCVSLGSYEKTVNGVGAALRLREGEVFAFNCSGPTYELTEEKIREDVGPRLAVMVSRIEAELFTQPVRP
ncbi:IclR family transcriptional regulator [Sedimentitalea sp.]|uniref:IclR family transcriptional regulator n=1 Tax=Sedimentitalea sp. TaxID=2048915 RepID=UPI003297DF58